MTIGWMLLALASPQELVSDPCTRPGACHHVDSIRIQTPDGKEQVMPVNMDLPWIADGNLLLAPGDSITVRLVKSGDGWAPEMVRNGTASATTAPGDGEIRVTVLPYKNGQLTMEVLSHRPETLDYSAILITPTPTGGNPQATSVCSLQPGITVSEVWRQPIQQLALFDFRPTKEPGCKTVKLKPKG